jgi:hypothetical protein
MLLLRLISLTVEQGEGATAPIRDQSAEQVTPLIV